MSGNKLLTGLLLLAGLAVGTSATSAQAAAAADHHPNDNPTCVALSSPADHARTQDQAWNGVCNGRCGAA